MRGMGTMYRVRGSRFLHIQYWVNGQRVRESSKKTREKEALEVLKQKLAEAASGAAPAARGALTVADLYQRMERDYIVNKRKSLIDLQGYWSNHLEPYFGRIRAGKVTSQLVDAYVDLRLQQDCTCKAKCVGHQAANASINRELSALKRMYKLAVQKGVLQFGQQPYIEMLQERNTRKGFLKDQEYEALAASTSRRGLWLRAIFEVAHTYGWRLREVTGLQVYQLDLLKRTINLDPGETKEQDARIVGMTKMVWELLSLCAAGKGANDYVFTRERDRLGRKTKNGGRIVDFRGDWQEACCEAGVGHMICKIHQLALEGNRCAGCGGDVEAKDRKYLGLFIHDLRRTYASNSLEIMDEKTAMRIAGWKTRSTFDRYNIVSRQKLAAAAASMERANRERTARARFSQGRLFDNPEMPPGPPRKPASPAENDSHIKAIAAAPARPN